MLASEISSHSDYFYHKFYIQRADKMAQRGDFGYGAVREYRDDPRGSGYNDNPSPRRGGYQENAYSTYNELVDQISSNIFTINNNGE